MTPHPLTPDPGLFAASDLDALARRSRGALQRYFARRGIVGSDGEDAIQDVFARLSRRVGQSTAAHIEGYLFETAASVAVDHFRRAKARHSQRHDPFEPDRHGGAHPGLEHDLIARQTLELVSLALRELPERTRTIFVLARLEGCQYDEVARRTGVSVSAVEKHMVKALAHLARRLKRPQR